VLVWRACARKPEQHQRQHAGVVDRPEERDVAQEIERRQHEQNRRDREQLQMSRNASVNEYTKGAEGRRPTPSCVRMSAAKRPISGVDDGPRIARVGGRHRTLGPTRLSRRITGVLCLELKSALLELNLSRSSFALLRLAVLHNVPIACNRSSADFLISSPLFFNQPYFAERHASN
jgi:hypothetical protein